MTRQRFNVIISKRAERMLLQHTEFLARVSTTAARKLIKSSEGIEVRLSDNPFQFPFADELDVPGIPLKTYRKCLIGKKL